MESPVVAHVNYLFFHSTQSYIHFYLRRFGRTRPICLTRTPESPLIDPDHHPGPGGRFLPVQARPPRATRCSARSTPRAWWCAGCSPRMPPRFSDPLLQALHRRIVPRLRPEADGARYLAWAGDILDCRRARLIHAYYGPVGWRMLALKRRLGVPLVVSFLGDYVAPQVGEWWSWWIANGAERPTGRRGSPSCWPGATSS